MFNGCSSLLSLDLSNFNTKKVTTMASMFYNDASLNSITFGANFDASSCTTMSSMFNNCSSLSAIDLSSCTTPNVNTMASMFYNCSSLTSLNISNFNTSNVTTMLNMFYGCSKLPSLDLSNFNTKKVTTMASMFYNDASLNSITFGANFDASSCTTMSSMFNNCSSLTAIDLSSCTTPIVTNMSALFSGCSSLTTLNINNFNTSNVTLMNAMFNGCSSLLSLNLSNFNTKKVTTMASMFYNDASLNSITIGANFDASSCITMSSMFYNCSSLTTIDLSSCTTPIVTNMSALFSGCSSLTTLNINNFNTSNVTAMNAMFNNCSSLTSITFGSNFNTSNVTTMINMFNRCSSLSSLDVSIFDTSKVTTMVSMFYGCSSLSSLDVSSFDTSKVTTMDSMFNMCSSLSSLDVSSFDTSFNASMSLMFANCNSLTSLNGLTNFNTENVLTMSFMFAGCFSLTELELSSFDTPKVTNMTYMFSMTNASAIPQDSSLNTITFGANFDPSCVTNMSYMFYNCNQLNTVQYINQDGSIRQGIDNWNTSSATNMTSMFENNEQLTTIGDVYASWDVTNVGSNHANFSLNSLLTNIPNFTDSQLDISGNLFLKQSGSDVQYSSSVSGPWTDVSSSMWPITLTNTDSPSSTLNVTLVTDLSLNALTQYFILDSSNITIDGSSNVVNINVDSYPGLIQNGTVDTSGNSDITIQNLGVLSTYSVAQAGGWIGQQYFGQNATDNNVINCYSTGTIGPAGGGIFGSYSSSQATNCYSTGTIGEYAGGIFGQSSDASASATNCYSTGPIGTGARGIFGPNSSGSATNCYCTGGTNIGGASQTYCYSTNGSANWLDASANDALDFSGNPWTDIDLNSDTVPYLLSAFTNTLYDPYSETNAIDSGDSLLTDCSFSIVSVNDENPSLYSGITIDSNTGDISFNSVSYGTTYVVNVLARNANDGYSFGTFTNIISNICFPAGTPIVTNQGIIAINKINPAIHTIRNKKIVAITKTVSPDKYLVRFEKDALGANLPCEATTMTQNHMLFYKGKMIKAKEFLKTHNESVTKVPYNGQVLYNVLMEEHDKMVVNNLICETLHPENYVAKMYHAFKILTPKQRVELIQKVNKEIIKRDIFSSTFGKGCNEVRAKNENEVRAKNGDKVRIQLTL